MEDEWQVFTDDPRTICKYGSKCYQKNPEHHKTFKHPPQLQNKGNVKKNNKRFNPYSREKKTPNQPSQIDAVKEQQCDKAAKSEDIQILEQNTTKLELPGSLTYFNSSDHDVLKEKFLVEMPQDFFKFFECLNDENNIEKALSSVNLELIGPYDLFLGKLPKLEESDLYLAHWRFFYDPPELQAVIKRKGKSEYHIGYFRDDPNEEPCFVASNDSTKDCIITPMADNIFGAILIFLQKEKQASPFTAVTCQKMMDKLKKYSTEHNISLNANGIKIRKTKIVTNSFHRAGIVVPYNKKTELGYRHLVETDAKLKKLFEKFKATTDQGEKDKILSELQPVITYASIAVDECDFGTGLEIGINIFCTGIRELHSLVLNNLCGVYNILKREAFAKIIQAHIKYRRKGPDMSLLSLFQK